MAAVSCNAVCDTVSAGLIALDVSLLEVSQDKWKTLVHTAQIAPHQRRGAPVPQELLDRVIQAHALWTEQLKAERDGCLDL